MSYFEHDDAIRSMLRRARILKVDDSGADPAADGDQIVDLAVLAGEKPTKIVRVQPFGIGSNPPVDSHGIVVALGGRSDRAMYFDGGHKDYREKDLPTGTAVLFDDKGNVVFVKGTNGIAIHAKQGKVYVKPADGEFVFLGGDGSDGVYALVSTVSGPAINVKAKIG
jgi:phage gp45-like